MVEYTEYCGEGWEDDSDNFDPFESDRSNPFFSQDVDIPERLQSLYVVVQKLPGEPVPEWNERMKGLEKKVQDMKNLRAVRGVSKARVWEVPHPPGLRAFEFSVDWDEVERSVEDYRLLEYVEQLRAEYLIF